MIASADGAVIVGGAMLLGLGLALFGMVRRTAARAKGRCAFCGSNLKPAGLLSARFMSHCPKCGKEQPQLVL